MGDEQLPAHLMNSLSRSLSSSSGDGAYDDNGSPLPLSITSSPINHKRSSSLSTITTVADPSSASSSAPVNDDRRLMTRAINEGDLDEVRRLLAAGCDPNAVFVKLSMLQYATLHEDVEMMQVRQACVPFIIDCATRYVCIFLFCSHLNHIVAIL